MTYTSITSSVWPVYTAQVCSDAELRPVIAQTIHPLFTQCYWEGHNGLPVLHIQRGKEYFLVCENNWLSEIIQFSKNCITFLRSLTSMKPRWSIPPADKKQVEQAGKFLILTWLGQVAVFTNHSRRASVNILIGALTLRSVTSVPQLRVNTTLTVLGENR